MAGEVEVSVDHTAGPDGCEPLSVRVNVAMTGTNGGTIETVGGNLATLANTTLTGGTYTGVDSSTTYVTGQLINQGTVTLASTGNNTELRFADGATISGGATIAMSTARSADLIFGLANSGLATVTNVDNTIQGAGQIGGGGLIEFLNRASGSVNATSNAFVLIINPATASAVTTPNGGGFMKQGLLEATGAGGLTLSGGQINNQGGVIQAIGTSVVSGSTIADGVWLENNVTVSGGLLTSSGGGILETIAGHSANLDATVTNGITLTGNYLGHDNSTTSINGVLTNGGTFTLGSTSLKAGDRSVQALDQAIFGQGGDVLFARPGRDALQRVPAGPQANASRKRSIADRTPRGRGNDLAWRARASRSICDGSRARKAGK